MSIIEDTFTVSAVDPDGKIFDRVSRIKATSESYGMDLTLDINCELFPLNKGQKISLLVAKTLELGAASSQSAPSYNPNLGPSLADKYEYVMYGKVYKLEEIPGGKMALYISFGGLLMRIETNPRYLTEVTNGSNLYLLMKRL